MYYSIWDVKVNVDGNVDGKTTKMDRNTCPTPTMAVLSRRGMTNLMVNLENTALKYL